MWARRKQYRNNDVKSKGFTIVELLIVVVVIAILAAISIVSYNGIQERAQRSQTATAVSQWEKIIKLYLNNNGDVNAFQEGTCLSSSPSDFPAGGGYVAGSCGSSASVVEQSKINLFKVSAVTSIPRTVLSPVSYGGVSYRGLYAESLTSIVMYYYLKGSTCLVSSDTAVINGGAVQCTRVINP